MSDVEHVEDPVRKCDGFSSGTFVVCHALEKLGFGEDRRVHDFNSSSRSIAWRSSSFDTVAVPIFITTMPPP